MNKEGYYEPEFGEEIKTAKQLEQFYKQGYRHCGIAYLRIILIAFVCFWNFGFPEPTAIVATISGFAIPCFYILSGYFILSDDNEVSIEKTKRKIKRSFLCFTFMFIFYLLINLLVCVIQSIPTQITFRSVFDFLVLNLWPLSIGSNIWFIQAMFMAYIVIFIAMKLNLMRYYKVILVLSLILMLLTGEFAGLIHFNIHGYSFIPGNWFTRAIPYILFGKYLREKEERLLQTAKWKYIALWLVGAVLSVAELVILVQTGFYVCKGHMIGYGIMACSACGLAISSPLGSESRLTSALTCSDPRLSNIIYMLMDPIFYTIILIAGNDHLKIAARFGGLAALALSILLAVLLKNTKLIKAMNS